MDISKNCLLYTSKSKQLVWIGETVNITYFTKNHSTIDITDTRNGHDEMCIRDRVGGDKFSYASDYEIVTKLKAFSDKYGICCLVVHHTRKMESSDSFDMISGTNGLLGAADGAFAVSYTHLDAEEKIEQLTQYSMLEQYDGDVLSNIIDKDRKSTRLNSSTL